MTKNEVENAIDHLKTLDLRSCSYEEVRRYTDVLVRAGRLMADSSDERLPIYRGRLVDPTKVFHEVGEISYPPRSTSPGLTFNRLSTNTHEVFYGAVLPEEDRLDQVTAMIEVGSSMRHDVNELEEYIQIGKWSVNQSFRLAIAGIHSELVSANRIAENFRATHRDVCTYIGEQGEIADLVANFISGELGKVVGEDEKWKYKISSAYGDGLFDAGVEAILYPSVKAEGRCFNIALHRTLVDRAMSIDVAAITRIRKFGAQIIVDWFLQSPRIKKGKFVWKEPPRQAVTGPYELKMIKDIMRRNGGAFMNPS